MIWNNTPYVYDRFDDAEISDDPVQFTESDLRGRETVITDGVAMSYRSYQRRKRAE